MNLENLDLVRKYSLEEIENDIANDKIYISERLRKDKKQDYIELLKKQMENGDVDGFCKSIRPLLADKYLSKSGRILSVPSDAHLTLGEGEFNRFYIRGLCVYAIKQNIDYLQIYRSKSVTVSRFGSDEKIGQLISAKFALSDLRNNVGVDTILGIPSGPNSGLSLRLQK